MNLLGICGFAGSGKDTAAQVLIAAGWERVAFADPVREGLLALNPIIMLDAVPSRLKRLVELGGWDFAKKIPEVRKLLQLYGTEAGRQIHGEDCWVRIAYDRVSKLLRDDRKVVVTDVRFPNEVGMVQALDGQVWAIVRDGYGPTDHESERPLGAIDGAINNCGTVEDLHRRVLQIVTSY